MRGVPGTLAALLGLGLGFACAFNVDPDQSRFSCSEEKDCGPGQECHLQLPTDAGLCYRAGACVAELCDGKDNDCNGLVDEGFDLSADDANCGQCGNVCAPGSRCIGGGCVETLCSDGIDNDRDAQADCADPDCLLAACDAADAGARCQRLDSDGGTPDAGFTGACL